MEETEAVRIGPTKSNMWVPGSPHLANQALKATRSTHGTTGMQGAACWARWELQLRCLHLGLTRRD